MKKLLLLPIFAVFFGFAMNAYMPTMADIEKIDIVKQELEKVVKTNQDIWKLSHQFQILADEYQADPQINTMLTALHQYLDNKLQKAKTDLKSQSDEFRENFLEIEAQNYTGVNDMLDKIKVLPECIEYYDLVDDISFAYDFPTELTIATRYREATCGMYLPNNTYGPFQIMSEDYGTGDLTQEDFAYMVVDFIEFSKAKHNSYKNKVDLEIGYNGFSSQAIINHLALYNGGYIQSGVVVPNKPEYVFDNYNSTYSGATKNGVYTLFLKLMRDN